MNGASYVLEQYETPFADTTLLREHSSAIAYQVKISSQIFTRTLKALFQERMKQPPPTLHLRRQVKNM